MPIADATVLDDVFADFELGFARIGGQNCISQSGGVFANADHYPGDWGSLPNTVSTCEPSSSSDIAEQFQGAIQLQFPSLPVAEACVLVSAPYESSQGFIRAYDDAEMIIDEALSDVGVPGELCLAAPGAVAVTFGGLGQAYVRLDDVRLLGE